MEEDVDVLPNRLRDPDAECATSLVMVGRRLEPAHSTLSAVLESDQGHLRVSKGSEDSGRQRVPGSADKIEGRDRSGEV
jgi:hypothetical protein